MSQYCVMLAMVIWMVAIAFACFTDNSWKNVGISWGLLAVGSMFFGIALTL